MSVPRRKRQSGGQALQALELDARDSLARVLQALRGDPRLSRWDEKFLSTVAGQIGAGRPVTPKQWAILDKLAPLLETDPPAEAEELAEELELAEEELELAEDLG